MATLSLLDPHHGINTHSVVLVQPLSRDRGNRVVTETSSLAPSAGTTAHQPYGVSVAIGLDANDSMKSIDEHIKKDQSDLETAKAEGNDAKVRHISEELESLQEYKKEHPEDSHDPTSLELYCEVNPEADECRVYDD